MTKPATKQDIAVLGAGSWGTALACLLADNGHNVCLWSHSADHCRALQEAHENQRYLPGLALHPELEFSCEITELSNRFNKFLLVVPSRAFRSVLEDLCSPGLANDSLILWGTKGFDSQSQQLLSQVVKEVVTVPHQKGVISGPSFAKEVMLKHPTALTAAANSLPVAEQIAAMFHNDYVRVYSNSDLVGVQVGGAIKNILAIACGISDGLGFGANAKSALITRGLTEISRLGLALGGKIETFQGLSGLGDLVLTCTDDKSRNRRFGLGIGSGSTISAVLDEIGQEVEGLVTCKEVHVLAQSMAIEMPICEQVYQILYNSVSPEKAVRSLLNRSRVQE